MWAKPVEGGFTLYLMDGGAWKPVKLVDDNSTITTTADDKAKVDFKVKDITKISNKQCKDLNVGDHVIKLTDTAQHLYTVTYKDDDEGGMCLSYIDAENAETVAYEKEGTTWKYLDTTITPLVG